MVLLLLAFLLPSHSEGFKPADWNAVWNDVSNIELNLNLLKTENQKLENAYQEQTLFSAKQAIQLKDLEKSSKQWKTATIVFGTCFTTMTVLYLIERNK